MASAQQSRADLVLLHGDVFTVDSQHPRAQAVAVRNGNATRGSCYVSASSWCSMDRSLLVDQLVQHRVAVSGPVLALLVLGLQLARVKHGVLVGIQGEAESGEGYADGERWTEQNVQGERSSACLTKSPSARLPLDPHAW